MMKKILFVVFFILIIGSIVLSCYLIEKEKKLELAINNENIVNEQKIITLDEYTDEKDVIFENVSSASYIEDISDNNVIANRANIIIIGTVTSIDGVINYNPKTDTYVMTRTVGKIKVNNVLKGNIEQKEIPFIRLGGIIPVIEYEKSLPEGYLEKLGLNKFSIEEKENKYISEKMEGDIKIEENKTYLMYLSYTEDYNKYSIQFAQYGLREVNQEALLNLNTLNSYGFDSIKVKNNETGEFETLDTIIPKDLL